MKRLGKFIDSPYKQTYDEYLEIFPLSLHPDLYLYAFDQGEFVYRTGDPIDTFYIFLEGTGKVYMVRENGRALLLEFYKARQVIGDLEFLSGQQGTTEVEATSSSVLLGISMERLRKEGWENPTLLRFLMGELSHKLMVSSFSNAGQVMPLKDRVIGFLEERSVKGSFIIDVKQGELADYFGVSERHLRRVFTTLTNEGFIKKTGKKIELLEDK